MLISCLRSEKSWYHYYYYNTCTLSAFLDRSRQEKATNGSFWCLFEANSRMVLKIFLLDKAAQKIKLPKSLISS